MNQIVDTLIRQDASKNGTLLRRGGSAPVLVAVELCNGSEAAVRWAGHYATAIGAALEILHVIHDSADSPGAYKSDNGDALEPMADVAERKLVEFVDRMKRNDPQISGLDAAERLCQSANLEKL